MTNALQWLRDNGAAQKTNVRHTGMGLRFKLTGLPETFTDAALGDLAEAQGEPVKVSTDKFDTIGGATASASADVTGEALATLFRPIAPPAAAPVNRVAAHEKNGSAPKRSRKANAK